MFGMLYTQYLSPLTSNMKQTKGIEEQERRKKYPRCQRSMTPVHISEHLESVSRRRFAVSSFGVNNYEIGFRSLAFHHTQAARENSRWKVEINFCDFRLITLKLPSERIGSHFLAAFGPMSAATHFNCQLCHAEANIKRVLISLKVRHGMTSFT